MALTLRQATVRDVASIARVCVESLPDDPTFDYLWRFRREYPEDNYFFWLQRLKTNLFDPKLTCYVATKPNYGGAVETIVSVALWQRHGITPAARSWQQQGWLDWIQRLVTAAENWAIARRYKRRDSDEARVAQFQKIMSRVFEIYWQTRHPDNWHLELLFTHPDHRKQGAATMLVEWGINQAEKEGADLGLESSPMGFPLYKSLGFVLIDEQVVQVEGDKAELKVLVMRRSLTGGEKITSFSRNTNTQ